MMKKLGVWALLGGGLTLLASELVDLAYGGSGKKSHPPIEVTVPVVSTPIEHVGFGNFRYDYVPSLKNHSAVEAAAVEKAETVLNQLLSTDCFKDFMLDANKNNVDLKQTNGLTLQQAYEKLLSYKLTQPVSMYYSRKKVVGYVLTGDPTHTIYTNRRVHNSYGSCFKASNFLHESSHLLGFTHDFKVTARRPKSVPYQLNRAIEMCCNDK